MRIPPLALLLLLCASLLLTALSSPGRGEIPSIVPNADASRTITWTMNDSTTLTAPNLAFGSGNASLPWTDSLLSWPNGTVIASEGALDSNLTESPSGIALAQNWSNRLADGDFSRAAPWKYVNGSGDNTTASWQPGAADARLNHSSNSTQRMWDNLDANPGNWSVSSSPGSDSKLFPGSSGNKMQGAGALLDFVNVSAGTASYAGALHAVPVDWSKFNRLSIWIYLNTSVPAAFNISAVAGLTSFNTSPIGLAPGWQDVVVDLAQLGPDRATMNTVILRIVGVNGQRVPPTKIYIDAIRGGMSKIADTKAFVYQTFTKGQETTPLPGSANLSFDWCLTNATGVTAYEASANLSGPSGFDDTTLAAASAGLCSHFRSDVSPVVTKTGTYNLSFSLQVVLNDTAASNVSLLIDNASFVFPGTKNGTYLSDGQTMGVGSIFKSLAWLGALPSPDTSVKIGLRSGNTSTPGGPTWTPWYTWSVSPVNPTYVPGAVYFQLRAQLGTSNASETPALESLSLTTQHRVDRGTILSGVFRAASDFISWRSFHANFSSGSGTSVTFQLGNGSYLSPVASGSSLASLQGISLQWQATLVTTDGLLTPTLHSVSVTYDFQGRPARVVLTASGIVVASGGILNVSSGTYVQLGALVYDDGSHLLPATVFPVAWSIDNATGGAVSYNGSYAAGKPGLYRISAVVVGSTIYASVRVNVTASTLPSSNPLFSLWDAWPVLAIGVAALAGFSLYELVIRRMFAIDDVFLIAKDGRLIVHNTRRMRADRDEDILSGMLTAIMAFLRDQDPEENGELKQFQVGGKTTLLERGAHVYLSAVYSGRVPGWAGKDIHRFVSDLEANFGDAFEAWSGSPEDLHDVKEYMQRFVSHVRYHGDRHAGPRAS